MRRPPNGFPDAVFIDKDGFCKNVADMTDFKRRRDTRRGKNLLVPAHVKIAVGIHIAIRKLFIQPVGDFAHSVT